MAKDDETTPSLPTRADPGGGLVTAAHSCDVPSPAALTERDAAGHTVRPEARGPAEGAAGAPGPHEGYRGAADGPADNQQHEGDQLALAISRV